jgi:hypothetical protein
MGLSREYSPLLPSSSLQQKDKDKQLVLLEFKRQVKNNNSPPTVSTKSKMLALKAKTKVQQNFIHTFENRLSFGKGIKGAKHGFEQYNHLFRFA